MPIHHVGAVDEIFNQFWNAWNTQTAAICGYVPEVHWKRREKPNSPDPDKHWLRINIRTVVEQQVTLRVETQRYRTSGIILVELYFSKSSLKATHDDLLAEVAKKAFVNPTTNVWFRRSSKNELQAEENWYRTNVTAEFEFDEHI